MAKKFVSVTLDLDEETLTILQSASLKKGSSVSDVAQELISKALQEIEQSTHGGSTPDGAGQGDLSTEHIKSTGNDSK